MHRTVSTPTRVLLALALAAAPARAATPEPLAPERFVYLLQYIAHDYESAVRDGAIVDEFEYLEMQELSGRLVDAFDGLRRLGASDESHAALLELREGIRRLDPPADVRDRGEALVERMLTELDLHPLPTSPPDLERGRAVFERICALCHGPTGGGDGPLAAGLDPPPVSYRDPRLVRVTQRQVFGAVSFGVPGTGMPSYRGVLSDEAIRDVAGVVLELRDTGRPGSASAASPPAGAIEALRDARDPRVRRWAAWTLERSGANGAAAIDALFAGLRDDDELVRSYAADALGRLGAAVAPRLADALATDPVARPHAETALLAIGGPAVPEVAGLLAGRGPEAHDAAVRILTGLGPAAEPALPAMLESFATERVRARRVRLAAAIGGVGAAAVGPLVQRYETPPDEMTRELALRALGFVGPAAGATVPRLLAALDDPDSRIRFSAASVLGKIGAPAAVPALAALVDGDPSETVRLYAIEALGAIGAPAASAAPALIRVFAQGDDNLAGRAAESLGEIGPAALPAVLAALAAGHPRTRGYAARALGRAEVEPARRVAPLVALLGDGDETVRDRAAAALIRLGEPAVPALIDALGESTDRRVRGHAALALGRMTPPPAAAVPALTAALYDRDDTVRQIACWSLGTLGERAASAVTALAAALESPESGLRRIAAWALGNVGPAAADATPALERLLHDPEAGVREEADEALRKLRGTYRAAGAQRGTR